MKEKKLKAVIFSDLHLQYSGPLNYDLDIPNDTDVVIVAGDVTAPIVGSINWLAKNIKCPVIFVAGNHEYYEHNYDEAMTNGIRASENTENVYFLENKAVVIGGVRFIGCTLWTDHNLYGDEKTASKHALLKMNDYRLIHCLDNNGKTIRWTPERTTAIHKESRQWLEKELAKPFDGKTVAVTHHCPHPLSCSIKYMGDPLNPSFTSDLSDVINTHQPDFWIHGHTHVNLDYIVPDTKTRVICNPRGYVKRRGSEAENPEFKQSMKIEI